MNQCSSGSQFNVAQKISVVSTITVSKKNDEYVLHFFTASMYNPTSLTGEALDVSVPVVMNSLDEVRGFVKGISSIFGIEFYVAEVNKFVVKFASWGQLSRLNLNVCYIKGRPLTAFNFFDNIFEMEVTKKPLK